MRKQLEEAVVVVVSKREREKGIQAASLQSVRQIKPCTSCCAGHAETIETIVNGFFEEVRATINELKALVHAQVNSKGR